MDTGASLSCHISNLTVYMLQICTVDYEKCWSSDDAVMINGSSFNALHAIFCAPKKASHVVACHGFWKAGRDVFQRGMGVLCV